MRKKDKELIDKLQKKIDEYQGPAVHRPDLIEAATTINIIRLQDDLEDCKLELLCLKEENARLKKNFPKLRMCDGCGKPGYDFFIDQVDENYSRFLCPQCLAIKIENLMEEHQKLLNESSYFSHFER